MTLHSVRVGRYLKNLKGCEIMPRLQKAAEEKICEICEKYSAEKQPLVELLKAIQNEFGYISPDMQKVCAEKLGIPVSEIYSTVCFYSFLSQTPKGKYVITVCRGDACVAKGALEVVDKLTELLRINIGETTADGMFSIDALHCIGACGVAPILMINGRIYPKVKLEDLQKIIDEYRQK